MQAHSKSRILIVDDSAIEAKLLSANLAKRGFAVFQCLNTAELLESIYLNKPDIILLDLIMPGAGGLTCLKVIRNQFSKLELPVIIVTSDHKTTSLKKAFSMGANDYIIKPIAIEPAIARINAHLATTHRQSQEVLERQIEAINAMVVTMRHEVNSPLAIAWGLVRMVQSGKKEPNLEIIDKIAKSLERIKQTMDELKSLHGKDPKFQTYTGQHKMLRLK